MSKIIKEGVPCYDGYQPSRTRGYQPKGDGAPKSGYAPVIKNESTERPKPPKSQ